MDMVEYIFWDSVFACGGAAWMHKEVHKFYGVLVETVVAVHEVFLHQEVPEYRHYERHAQAGCRIVAVGLEAEVFEKRQVIEHSVDGLGAVDVEQERSGPYQGIFHGYGLDGDVGSVEGEPVIDAAVDGASAYGSDGRGNPGLKMYESEKYEAYAHVDPRGDL